MILARKIFGKISLKLIGVVSATAIIIIGVYSYFNVTSQSDVLLAEVERHANQLSESVKNSTRYVMLLNQRDHIQEMINRIGKDPAIDNVRILNKEGEIIYSAHPEDIGKMLDKQAESCYACHAENKALEKLPIQQRTRIFKTHSDSSRILGIINPIYNEKSCSQADCHAHYANAKVLGVLDITISLSEVDEQIRQNEIREILFAIISITAIGFIIGFFVKRSVDHPVRELVNATDQVSAGNLNYIIKNLSTDELGTLGKSFNNMIKKLDETSQQLYQSTKMASLGQLAAGVAHEINNPLTGVLTYSSFLLKRTKDNAEFQDDLKVIVRETLRCREIVKSLLDFARQTVPKKNNADLNEIIDKAVTVIENQLQINKVKLIKEVDKFLPKITVDANQMQQVFINLFVNAADAIGENGGTLRVITHQISLSPYGLAQIKKAVCPKRHNLLDNEFKIGGFPSLKVKVISENKEGIIHLDPVYGKHRNVYDLGFAVGKDVKFVCPDCNISLVQQDSTCPVCNAPILAFDTSGHGIYEVCSSEKNNWERWEFVDSA